MVKRKITRRKTTRKKRRIVSRIWFFLWRFMLFLTLILLLFRFVPLPTTAFMLQSPYPVTQKWIDIDELPSHMALAVVAAEDQRFPDHMGLDFTAITQALKQYKSGHGLRGASTITQQTAKNLFLWSGRSLSRKVIEATLALSIEGIWGKKRILEVYLNIAEFGQGIYGVEAASQHYFGKSANSLTKNQAARLAVMLPSPRTRKPNELTFYLRQRVLWVEKQMRQLSPNHLKTILK